MSTASTTRPGHRAGEPLRAPRQSGGPGAGVRHPLRLLSKPNVYFERTHLRHRHRAVQDPFPLYDDVRHIYTDHETFSSDYYFDQHQAVYGPVVGEHRRFLDIFLQQFMLTDPPAHTEIRRLLRSAFTPRYLKRWQTVVEEVTEAA